jgi:hypothetical protein
MHKPIYSIWNKNELLKEWKESITVPICKRANKADYSNYRGISLLSSTYNILSYILLSRLTPNAEGINEYHQCGFGCNRSTADHIFGICKILQKKSEYNEVVPQLFIDFKKTCI